MADMTRETAIGLIEHEREYMLQHGGDAQAAAFDAAISDMKRVEELEAEVASAETLLSAFNMTLEYSHEKKLQYYSRCKVLEAENKRLKEGIANIKAEIGKQEKWLSKAEFTIENVDAAFDAIKSVVEKSDKE